MAQARTPTVPDKFALNATVPVQVSLGLVGAETSTNGVAPSPTIQGLSTTLTYTFTEQQRTGVATNQ
jgi:hypothetical protein